MQVLVENLNFEYFFSVLKEVLRLFYFVADRSDVFVYRSMKLFCRSNLLKQVEVRC